MLVQFIDGIIKIPLSPITDSLSDAFLGKPLCLLCHHVILPLSAPFLEVMDLDFNMCFTTIQVWNHSGIFIFTCFIYFYCELKQLYWDQKLIISCTFNSICVTPSSLVILADLQTGFLQGL